MKYHLVIKKDIKVSLLLLGNLIFQIKLGIDFYIFDIILLPPIATSAQPHEISLASDTIDDCPISEKLRDLIGDRAYDMNPHDAELRAKGVNLIAPHKWNRKRPKTQDGRALEKYAKH